MTLRGPPWKVPGSCLCGPANAHADNTPAVIIAAGFLLVAADEVDGVSGEEEGSAGGQMRQQGGRLRWGEGSALAAVEGGGAVRCRRGRDSGGMALPGRWC